MANAVVEGVEWGTMEGADEEVGVVSRVEEGEGGGEWNTLDPIYATAHPRVRCPNLELLTQSLGHSVTHSHSSRQPRLIPGVAHLFTFL